jgi:hypothetical protein
MLAEQGVRQHRANTRITSAQPIRNLLADGVYVGVDR